MRREDYGMRILLMNHFPLQGSGSGVYTINIAHALVRKGHEVCIIMPENEELAELETGGVRLHPVYFDSCVDEALDFDFPCFTTHPRSVTTFYERLIAIAIWTLQEQSGRQLIFGRIAGSLSGQVSR